MDRQLKILGAILIGTLLFLLATVPYDFIRHQLVTCDTDTDCLEKFDHEMFESPYQLVRAFEQGFHRFKLATDPQYAFMDQYANNLLDQQECLSTVIDIEEGQETITYCTNKE